MLTQVDVDIGVFNSPIVSALLQHKWNAFGRSMFMLEVYMYVFRDIAWQALVFMIVQHGNVLSETGAGPAVLAASSVKWLLAVADAYLPLVPRSAMDGSYGCVREPFADNLMWYLGEGWFADAEDNEHTWWSLQGAIWGSVSYEDDYRERRLKPVVKKLSARICCVLVVLLPNPSLYFTADADTLVVGDGGGYIFFLLLWPLVIWPGISLAYYALALAARPAPLLAACSLLGATTDALRRHQWRRWRRRC